VHVSHPYTDDDTWLRGNVHTHTTESDGEFGVAEVIDEYESRGYDYLAVSDHDLLVDPEEYRDDTSLTLVPAVEVTAHGPHVVHVGASERVEPRADRQAVVDDVREQGGVAVPAHPNWQWDFDHWPQDDLADLSGYHGIEIYNGTVERHPGTALATDRWDQLLTDGREVWAFGTDDTHAAADVESAWTVVQVAENTPAAIVDALRSGRSYVSTGVAIEEVGVEGGEIRVRTADDVTARLVSDGGRVQRESEGTDHRFDVSGGLPIGDGHTYVRVECLGRGVAGAWTQPFRLEGE
jgi:hypothetical protein